MWIDDNTREEVNTIPEGYTHFVYLIYNTTNNKAYVGQKGFYNTTHKKPLKGRKNRRKVIKESDWKSYTGSNAKLNKDIQRGHKICKVIIHYCSSKSEATYKEAKEQFDRNVLYDDSYYNELIALRIRKPC